MGSIQNFVCGECIKEDSETSENRLQNLESYFIGGLDKSEPKNVTDIKVDTKNFITKSAKNVYDIYEKISQLGNGAYGTVYKVKRKNSGFNVKYRALKEISKEKMMVNSENSSELKNEIDILKDIDHPNIMKIYEFFEDEKNIYLINEYCGGGDVANLHDNYGVFPRIFIKIYNVASIFSNIIFTFK